MRTKLVIAALSLAGCNWMDFDDLSEQAWVRSTDDAHIGSRNYALAIAGVSTSTSGGLLGVISDDSPDYSTIDYGTDGVDRSGQNDLKLNQHRIAALTDPPLFVTDGAGKFLLAERSTTGGNIAVVFGAATSPAGQEFPAVAAPDAVAFAGGNAVVAAGNTFYTLQGSTPIACAPTSASFASAAMAANAQDLFVWTKSGMLVVQPLAQLSPCGTLVSDGPYTTSLVPAPGARVHLAGNYAILTAHAQSSRMGQVFVVDVTNPALPVQTDTLMVEGLQSSALATFGTSTYLAVGVPDRAVDGVITGQVDVFALDTTTGTLTQTPAMSLHDAQPESGAQFGRSVTTMKFNDQEILVVAAKSEVFAYYKTTLYDALP